MNNIFKLKPSPENSKEFKRLIQTGIALDNAVEVIRRVKDGIPENLDRRCIQETGMRVQQLSNFYLMWHMRMAFSLNARTEEENVQVMTGYFDKMVTPIGEGKEDVVHMPREEHDKYIHCFNLFRKNPKQCCEFVGDIFSYATTLTGSGK